MMKLNNASRLKGCHPNDVHYVVYRCQVTDNYLWYVYSGDEKDWKGHPYHRYAEGSSGYPQNATSQASRALEQCRAFAETGVLYEVYATSVEEVEPEPAPDYDPEWSFSSYVRDDDEPLELCVEETPEPPRKRFGRRSTTLLKEL